MTGKKSSGIARSVIFIEQNNVSRTLSQSHVQRKPFLLRPKTSIDITGSPNHFRCQEQRLVVTYRLYSGNQFYSTPPIVSQ